MNSDTKAYLVDAGISAAAFRIRDGGLKNITIFDKAPKVGSGTALAQSVKLVQEASP